MRLFVETFDGWNDRSVSLLDLWTGSPDTWASPDHQQILKSFFNINHDATGWASKERSELRTRTGCPWFRSSDIASCFINSWKLKTESMGNWTGPLARLILLSVRYVDKGLNLNLEIGVHTLLRGQISLFQLSVERWNIVFFNRWKVNSSISNCQWLYRMWMR